MARLKIIILETYPGKICYAFWADVPLARQPFYADAGKVSAWKDATAADNAALQNGSVVELAGEYPIEEGAGAARIQQVLRDLHGKYQARIDAHNPWSRYGTAYDTAWTAGGVA